MIKEKLTLREEVTLMVSKDAQERFHHQLGQMAKDGTLTLDLLSQYSHIPIHGMTVGDLVNLHLRKGTLIKINGKIILNNGKNG